VLFFYSVPDTTRDGLGIYYIIIIYSYLKHHTTPERHYIKLKSFFLDVAIGAPWENDGTGVVYIYRGNGFGLEKQYSQRIIAEGAKSFGISLSKGYDVDKNKCNGNTYIPHTLYFEGAVETSKMFLRI
jgi:hypothetical protein